MKPIRDGGPPHLAAYDLSARVLDHARRQQWDAAAALLDRIGGMGVHGQLTFVYAMADTIALVHEHVAGPAPDGAVIAPAWTDADTGAATDDADRVPPAERWVGRFICARAADDRDTCEALLGAFAEGDDEGWSEAVSALVTTAALTINGLIGEPR